MKMLKYTPEIKHTLQKETDYVIHTKYGQTRVAGLFNSHNRSGKYEWVTAEGMKVIDNDTIQFYSPLEF